MDMETWPSLVLRLLARLLQQGANFLEQQGQKVKRLAEQTASERTSSAEGDDDRSVPAEETSQPTPSSGQPPDHWLEKIEDSEGPIQWIEHTGDPADGPHRLSPSSPLSVPRSFPPDRGKQSGRDPSSSPTTGEMRSTPRGRDARTDDITRRTTSEGESSLRFEESTDSVASEKSDRSRQSEKEKASGERTSGPDSSASDSDTSRSRSSPSPSESIRLQPSSSKTRSEKETETARENDGRVEQIGGDTSEASQRPSRSASSTWTEPEVEFPGDSASEEHPSSTSDSRKKSSGSERTTVDSAHSSEARPTDDPVPLKERDDFSGQRISPSPASVGNPGPGGAERGGSFSDSAAVSDVNDVSDSDRSFLNQKEEASADRSSHFPWPDLPDAEQILQDQHSDPRRWEGHMRSWERRRRLNREQRGQLWSE